MAREKKAGQAGQLTDGGGEVLLDATKGPDGEPLPPAGDNEERQDGGWNAEAEHGGALDRMTAMVDELDLATRDTLVSDVQVFLVDTIKARPKPWSGTSQQEQRDVIAACRHAATELVRKVVEAVAAGGTDSIRVLLTKVSLGNDIVITGKVKAFEPEEEDRAVSTLHHALNKHVMLTRASADDYKGGGEEPDAEPDEPEFGYEGDDADLADEEPEQGGEFEDEQTVDEAQIAD